VASVTTIHPKAKIPQRQGNVIENHEDLFRVPAEKTSERANRSATFVHVGHRLNQENVIDLAGPGFPLGLELELLTRPVSQGIENSKPDIVAGIEVFVSGISETDDAFEAHKRRVRVPFRDGKEKRPKHKAPGVLKFEKKGLGRGTGFSSRGTFFAFFPFDTAFGFSHAGLVHDCDEDVSSKDNFNPIRNDELTNGEGIANFEVLDACFDLLGKIFRRTRDLEVTNKLLDDTAGFDANGLAGDLNRDGSTDLHSLGHGQEIGVHKMTTQWIILGGLEESCL